MIKEYIDIKDEINLYIQTVKPANALIVTVDKSAKIHVRLLYNHEIGMLSTEFNWKEL